jgi:hypothetical protein
MFRVAALRRSVSFVRCPSIQNRCVSVSLAARIAPLVLIKPAKDNPEVVVAAVAARDRSRARAFAAKHGIPRVHDPYDALIRDPELNAIYNPLPNGLHGRWTRAALEADKHAGNGLSGFPAARHTHISWTHLRRRSCVVPRWQPPLKMRCRT